MDFDVEETEGGGLSASRLRLFASRHIRLFGYRDADREGHRLPIIWLMRLFSNGILLYTLDF